MRAGTTGTSTINPWISSNPSSMAQARQSESRAVPPQWLPVLLASCVVPASTPPSPLSPPPPPPSPSPAPPCTVEMLKQRPAGDKSWPIACSNTTLGTADKELDLSGANLSYGDFKEATFTADGVIRLNGAGLAHADLSGSKLTADGGFGNALIDFGEADLTNADLSGSELTAVTRGSYGSTSIDFTEAALANADLSGSILTRGGDPESWIRLRAHGVGCKSHNPRS
eukprot:scaffold66219_cov62-Phaeocystis_antarctica.AAC.2